MLGVAVGLALSTAIDIHANLPLLCGSPADHLSLNRIAASWQFLLMINPPTTLALAWLTMLVAMMTPLIALPLAHVRASSLFARRWRASAGFLLGYFCIWGIAGMPLLLAAFFLRLVAGSVLVAFLLATLLALVWSASPIQQAAQNRAHRQRRIGLFGLAADRDCIMFGAAVGGWCLVSCWTWMLVPFFVPFGHVFAMIAVSGIVLAERLRGPGPVRWRTPVVLLPLVRRWGAFALHSLRGGEGSHV